MPIYVRRYLGRSALRNSDKRLVPAIIACNFSVCFLIFGIFLTISGVIFRSVAAANYSITDGVRPQVASPSRTAVTVGTVILSIGSILAGIGIALLIYAWVCFKRYETMRREELHSNAAPVSTINYETSFSSNLSYSNPYPVQYQHNQYEQPLNQYQSQQLYSPPDDFEAPPSYSTIDNNSHQTNTAQRF